MSTCTMLVELPEEVRVHLATRNPMLDADFESRGHNRINAFSVGFLQITSNPKVLRETKEIQLDDEGGAVIKDVSRTGIGLYFHQQLYPLQTFVVQFQSRTISAAVVRCRYLGPRCYEVGAIIDTVRSYRE